MNSMMMMTHLISWSRCLASCLSFLARNLLSLDLHDNSRLTTQQPIRFRLRTLTLHIWSTSAVTHRSSFRPRTLISQQHSLISGEVMGCDSSSGLSKVIWSRNRWKLDVTNICSDVWNISVVVWNRTALALLKKSTGFSAFKNSVTEKVWYRMSSPSL